MKKLLYLLLVACFATTTAFAYDDDEDEDEEIVAPKKTAKPVTKSAAKKAKKSSESEASELKLGFYGSIAGGMTFMQIEGKGIPNLPAGSVGLLFNLGNGLEIGLGIGMGRVTVTRTIGDINIETSGMTYEVVPSVSYQIGKAEAISFGAGLDIHLASWSLTQPDPADPNLAITVEPSGMDMAFFPNFNIRAELAKNFQVGLKMGLMAYMPPKNVNSDEGTDSSTEASLMFTRTEVGFNYYIDI